MGAWGYNIFENDTAADFEIQAIHEGSKAIYTALQNAVDIAELDSLECEEALAAAEFLAAAKGKPSADCSDEVKAFVQANEVLTYKKGLFSKRMELTPLALRAIDRIEADSELKDLWEDAEELDKWLEVVHGLKARLA